MRLPWTYGLYPPGIACVPRGLFEAHSRYFAGNLQVLLPTIVQIRGISKRISQENPQKAARSKPKRQHFEEYPEGMQATEALLALQNVQRSG
jgi:hypothetical protein